MFEACIIAWSLSFGINPIVTKAIIKTESNFNPKAVGSVGEVGLMQIRPEYVEESALQLFDPCTNIRRGVQILKEVKKSCKHQIDRTWVICYNLGIGGANKIKHPKLFPYYKKVITNIQKMEAKE